MHRLILDSAVHLLLVAVLLITATATCAGETDKPRVDFSLERQLLYVGESPRLRISVTAPAGSAATVVTADRVRTRCCLHAKITDPAGRAMWCLDEPHRNAVLADSDFSEVPAGQRRLMEFEIPYFGGVMPGEYRMEVQFVPTKDRNFVARHELTLTYRAIPPADIQSQVRIPVPPNSHLSNQRGLGFVSFMNVKTDRGSELLFYREKPALLSRVLSLDPDSKLTVLPKYFDEKSFEQEFWVVFNKGGKLYLAQLDHVTGNLLRTTIIEVPRFTPRNK
jgi:hypothetical protein